MDHLIVGTDGSQGARAAVDEAMELAVELGAKLTFVHVRELPSPLVGDPYYQNRLTEELAQGRRTLAEAQELAEEAGVEAECELLEGDPVEELLRLATARQADMIVVGSRGLGNVRSTLLGSVSQAITRRADRPVLMVKREPAGKRLPLRQRA